MRVWVLVVIGAVLPMVGGASLGSITSDEASGTWSAPVAPTAFLLLSLVLAVSHVLVALGYRVVGSAPATVAAAGSVLLGGCEVWSGLSARTDLDAGSLDVLEIGYGVAAVVVLLGTAAAGLALRTDGSPLAAPLLLNAAVLAVATVVRFTASDGLGIAALTVWSLTYVWFGVRLRTVQRTRAGGSADVHVRTT